MLPDLDQSPDMGSRVLIVDDDALFLDATAAVLSNAGYAVSKAESGKEASDALDRTAPDLVILDCGLAEPSELGLIDALQRLPVRPRIMILSARRGEWHHRIMRSFGAGSVREKPISAEELLGEVRKLLAIRKRSYG